MQLALASRDALPGSSWEWEQGVHLSHRLSSAYLGRGGLPLAGIPRGEAGSWSLLTGHEANQEAGFLIPNPVILESCLLLIIICVY